MQRKTFMMRALPGKKGELESKLHEIEPNLLQEVQNHQMENFSVWNIEDLYLGYGEYADNDESACQTWNKLSEELKNCAEILCPLGTMRLMYHCYGIVRQDKSLIRHRVFAAKLKPGCVEEYKRRHDALVEARGDQVSDGPESNFSIWYGAGYIFGYCERVKAYDLEMTEEERQNAIAWETRQLEIMDWLTDDVDWITGQKHDAIRRII